MVEVDTQLRCRHRPLQGVLATILGIHLAFLANARQHLALTGWKGDWPAKP